MDRQDTPEGTLDALELAHAARARNCLWAKLKIRELGTVVIVDYTPVVERIRSVGSEGWERSGRRKAS